MVDIMTKRIFDIIISIITLILTFPILIFITLLIKKKLGSPIFFKQSRPGLRNKPFVMYKFRTMTNEKNDDGNYLPDEERLNSFGKFLRSTSIDELPTLWNVIIGEMSLVGPRPLLMEYLPLYSQDQARRHNVKPGITGWAQVNGRNAISWEKKFKYDIWYIDNHNIWLDSKILALTIKKVFIRDGISAENDATMPKFTGSKVDNFQRSKP